MEPDKKINSDIPDQPKPKRVFSGGLAILIIILVICAIAAYFISTLTSSESASVGQIIRISNPATDNSGNENTPSMADNTEQTEVGGVSGQFIGQNDLNPEGTTEIMPPREGIEAAAAQVRALRSIADGISSFRLSQGRYPESINEMIAVTGFALPQNPFNRAESMKAVSAGDYSPGDFTYLPFGTGSVGAADGFILIAYADRMENGFTIEDPNSLISPKSFHPPLHDRLYGVSTGMYEGGTLIDMTIYQKTQNTGNEE